jgi:predicted DNA-binding transcriptional regulator AlpA
MSDLTCALPDTTLPNGLPAIVREPELTRWLGVTRRTLLNWSDRGLMPKPIKFAAAGRATKAWAVQDIRDWIDAKRQQAIAA